VNPTAIEKRLIACDGKGDEAFGDEIQEHFRHQVGGETCFGTTGLNGQVNGTWLSRKSAHPEVGRCPLLFKQLSLGAGRTRRSSGG
jgi:hypothetical protein